MESYTDEQGTTLLEHNALSQLTSIAYASGLTVTLTPNHLNWNTKTTLPKTSGTEDTSYAYDLRGRVLSITVPDTSATTITIARDSMGRPTTIVYSGSHTVVYAIDAMGRSTTITSTGKDAANTYVLTYAYVANADRVSSVTTTAAGVTVSTQTYTYNQRNQITKEKVQDGTPTTTWERDYSWTAAGLRTKVDDLFNEWDSTFAHDPAGRLSLIQTTDNSGASKANPFPWWEGDTRVSTSPSGDVVSMVSGSNRITYRYDEEMRLVEAQMASGDPVPVTYAGMGSLVSIVQGGTTQKTLTYQGRVLQTRNASDVLQDRLFWAGNNLMRVDLNAAARNQAWDAQGSNVLTYQTDGTMDKTRLWDAWGLEVFAAGAGSAPDVGFRSDFDLGSSGLSTTPQNNAWWAELGRSVEGGWRPEFFCWWGDRECVDEANRGKCFERSWGLLKEVDCCSASCSTAGGCECWDAFGGGKLPPTVNCNDLLCNLLICMVKVGDEVYLVPCEGPVGTPPPLPPTCPPDCPPPLPIDPGGGSGNLEDGEAWDMYCENPDARPENGNGGRDNGGGCLGYCATRYPRRCQTKCMNACLDKDAGTCENMEKLRC
ncbi:hypothetical protein IIA16_02045 [bacterium]|nr:hypothetical protein [bacterium]